MSPHFDRSIEKRIPWNNWKRKDICTVALHFFHYFILHSYTSRLQLLLNNYIIPFTTHEVSAFLKNRNSWSFYGNFVINSSQSQAFFICTFLSIFQWNCRLLYNKCKPSGHSLAFPRYRPLQNITWKKHWLASLMSLIPTNLRFSSVNGLDPTEKICYVPLNKHTQWLWFQIELLMLNVSMYWYVVMD